MKEENEALENYNNSKKRNRRTPNPPSDNHDRKTMTIEYDEEDRCIRVDGELFPTASRLDSWSR